MDFIKDRKDLFNANLFLLLSFDPDELEVDRVSESNWGEICNELKVSHPQQSPYIP